MPAFAPVLRPEFEELEEGVRVGEFDEEVSTAAEVIAELTEDNIALVLVACADAVLLRPVGDTPPPAIAPAEEQSSTP